MFVRDFYVFLSSVTVTTNWSGARIRAIYFPNFGHTWL